MIEKKCCENCALENMKEFCSCKYDIEYPVEETDMFMPKEELIRQDEIEKAIQLVDNIRNSKVNFEKFNYKEICDLIIIELKMNLLESRWLQ